MWLLLAFLTALSESFKDVFSKFSLKNTHPVMVAFAMRMFALPFLIPLLWFIEIPETGDYFWIALFTGGLLNILITILYLNAIQHSDLSLTVPMVTFTPLFLLITSPLILGEIPDAKGIAGVLCIVAGSYFLQFSSRKKGFLAPFATLFSEKGPRLMLLVAFLWSITANIDKVGVQNSSPFFWVISVSVFLFIGMIPLVFWKARGQVPHLKNNFAVIFPVGLFTALTLIFQMHAIELTHVAYVIAVKRTSALFVVFFGVIFFKEKGFGNRVFAVLIMLLGVALISVF
ncbi:MAG: EamA family transporter [Bacteroidetes bacterium]|nr:MAG: EamA family transporter [Bacteroidota bacterium]